MTSHRSFKRIKNHKTVQQKKVENSLRRVFQFADEETATQNKEMTCSGLYSLQGAEGK